MRITSRTGLPHPGRVSRRYGVWPMRGQLRIARESSSSFPYPIVGSTKHWLAINKPTETFSFVTGAPDHPRSVVPHLLAHFPLQRQRFSPLEQYGIVHRIDTNTTGILLIALSPAAYLILKSQFRQRSPMLKKTYLVLVHGALPKRSGMINEAIWMTPGYNQVFNDTEGPKTGVEVKRWEAYTEYEVLRTFVTEAGTYSLVQARILTGKKHQIRFHFQQLGHPVVGDRLYFCPHIAPHDSFVHGFFPHGQALHAANLSFRDPEHKRPVHLACAPPENFRRAITWLEAQPSPDRTVCPLPRRSPIRVAC